MAKRKKKKAPRPNQPFRAFSKVLDYFDTYHLATVDDAMDQFLIMTDPDPEKIAAEQLNGFMREWFVFDYQLPTARSPLEEYIELNPDSLDEGALSDLRQAQSSNMTVAFWINNVDRKEHIITLEALDSDLMIEVYDVSGSKTIPGNSGMIVTRVIQQQDQWFLAGNPLIFMPVAPTDSMRAMMKDSGSPPRTDAFLSYFRQFYASSKPRDDSGITTQLSHAPLDEQEAKELLKQQQTAYNKLRKKHGIDVMWSQIKRAIKYEDGQSSPLDTFKMLYGLDEDIESGFPDEEVFMQVFGIFTDCWNLLPHLSLGNKSPNQISREMEAVDMDGIIDAINSSCADPVEYYIDPVTLKVDRVHKGLLELIDACYDMPPEQIISTIHEEGYYLGDYSEDELLKWINGYEFEVIFIDPLPPAIKFEVMQQFIEDATDDEQVARELETALEGTFAFKDFEAVLMDHEIEDEFYQILDSIIEELAYLWVERNVEELFGR